MLFGSNIAPSSNAAAFSWDDCGLLVESVADYAIFMLDPGGRVATWNSGAARIFGYHAEEIVGEHFSKFFTVECIGGGEPERELELALAQGRYEQEKWRVRKDGSRFWANIVITALRDDSGRLRGFGNVTHDLTARTSTEIQLHQADRRFHQLVDAVIDYAIFLLDPSGRIATWNAGASRLKGYKTDEIVGKHFSVFYPEGDKQGGKPERVLEAVRSTGRHEEEGWRIRKDGSRFWANVVITALRDETNELLGFVKVTRDLTERKKNEDELERSEKRFRLLVENISDYAIYMLDPTGLITTWNLGAERMKGYAASEVIGKNFSMFFPTEDIENGKPARELELARFQDRYEDEGLRVRKDGSTFWANAILTALHDTRGELIGFAKITRDLTARRAKEEAERRLLREQAAREAAENAEQRLKENEERYRALSRRLEIVLEGVADGITVQNRAGQVVYANAAAARFCGFESGEALMSATANEIVERFDILDIDGRPLDASSLPGRKVLNGEEGSSVVLCIRDRRSQREWWVLLRANAVLGPDGSPELAINIWHDVTAERRDDRQTHYLAEATAALSGSLQETELFSKLAEALVPGLGDWCSIYLLDGAELVNVGHAHVDSRMSEVATEYRRKYPPNRALPGGVREVIRSGRPQIFNGITEEVLKNWSTEQEGLNLLREIDLKAAVIAPLRGREGALGAISLFTTGTMRRYDDADCALIVEIGRRAGATLENVRLYEAAQSAAKTAEEASLAKDEFLATVSHELRTPLNAILGWSSILRDRVTDNALVKPIEVIHRNAQAQVKIVDDILDLSRVITGNFRIDARPVDIVAIAQDAIEVVRPSAAAKQIRIHFVQKPDLCLLIADPERLQQVIWNLLSNAVRFTGDDGEIRLTVAQDGGKVVLSVSDTGKGIDPAFLPFVFDRFRQADSTITRRVGGLGLGLALVKHIVELHGGTVVAESAGIGKGATFMVALPIRAVIPVPAESRSVPKTSALTPKPSLHGVRVLVIDDENDAREMVAEVLESAGAVVETARSTVEGYECFKRNRPDVLVSDLGMPDEDGYSLMRRVRALPKSEGAGVPSLALTAFTRTEDRTKALAAGYTTHVGKPVDPLILVSAVANLAFVGQSR